MNAVLAALRQAGLLPDDHRLAIRSAGSSMCAAMRDGVASVPLTELVLMLGLLALARL